MARRSTGVSPDDTFDLDAALASLDAEALRALLRDLVFKADEDMRGRIMDSVVDHAAHGSAGWIPVGPPAETISSITSFAREAARMAYAEPWQIDECLREGVKAFLSRHYRAASEVFGCLLVPIGDGEINLGQDELADEVLSVDLNACAAMHAVAAYMCAEAPRRADAVLSAIHEMFGVAYLSSPLREMERVAVDPLPEFDRFLRQWQTLLEVKPDDRDGRGTQHEKYWLREVIERTEGVPGLARLAKNTRRAEDLRAWCHALVGASDWKAALTAFEEAANTVSNSEYARGEFLDGAAVAAKELGGRDLPARLERAWREAPTMHRLRRWLGSATNKATTKNRATQALEACPSRFARQLGLLHVVVGEPDAAAILLANAPGLGWSNPEHPGRLLFPLFRRLLGGTESPMNGEVEPYRDDDDFYSSLDESGGARLNAPAIEEIEHAAGVLPISDDEMKAVILRAMRKAAEKRVAGVTSKQRRNYYDHAARLVAVCAALDAGPQTVNWVAGIRQKYRRYSALQREFSIHLGAKPKTT